MVLLQWPHRHHDSAREGHKLIGMGTRPNLGTRHQHRVLMDHSTHSIPGMHGAPQHAAAWGSSAQVQGALRRLPVGWHIFIAFGHVF